MLFSPYRRRRNRKRSVVGLGSVEPDFAVTVINEAPRRRDVAAEVVELSRVVTTGAGVVTAIERVEGCVDAQQ
jgi:hypothetical protein